MARRRSGNVESKLDGRLLGSRIREIRIKKGMSARRLADQVGVLGNYISQLERGDKVPSLETLIHIANTLGVTTDDLLCDYLDAERVVVNQKVNIDISSLDKRQQRFIEQLVALVIQFLKPKN